MVCGQKNLRNLVEMVKKPGYAEIPYKPFFAFFPEIRVCPLFPFAA